MMEDHWAGQDIVVSLAAWISQAMKPVSQKQTTVLRLGISSFYDRFPRRLWAIPKGRFGGQPLP